MGMKTKSSFIVMMFAVVGVVLYVSMFLNVMTAFETVRSYANISSFTALSTIVQISPTVLLIAGIFAASFGYYKGYKGAAAQDASGVLRMVFGVVQIILFVSLFSTILTNMYYLYDGGTTTNATFQPSNYTAFQTVTGIAPTVLFLSGIFGGVATAVSGYSARRGMGRGRLS